MRTLVLPKVDTSVAFQDKNGKVVLLGNGGSTSLHGYKFRAKKGPFANLP